MGLFALAAWLALAAPGSAGSLIAPTCERYMASGMRPAAASKSCCRLIMDSCAPKVAAAEKDYRAKLKKADQVCSAAADFPACFAQWNTVVLEAEAVMNETRGRCKASKAYWCQGMGPDGLGKRPD